MFSYYFNVALIYFIIGFSVALLFFFGFKKKMHGKFWGALIVACLGAFFGGLADYFFSDIIEMLSNLNGAVNIFPPVITSFIVVWLFAKASGDGRKR